MEIKDYFRLFTEKELLQGAELYYAGDVENIKFQSHLGKPDKGENVFRNYPLEGTLTVSGSWKEDHGMWKNHEMTGSLRLDEERGIICDTSCSCDEYDDDRYGCRHMAALLTAYMIKNKGEEVFRGTRLETLLCNLTNAEDPFQPGVLKRTDRRILFLLKVLHSD